jgi:hypothetical protein
MAAFTEVLSFIGGGTFGSIVKMKDTQGAYYSMKRYELRE